MRNAMGRIDEALLLCRVERAGKQQVQQRRRSLLASPFLEHVNCTFCSGLNNT
jgi:hypothetical protein